MTRRTHPRLTAFRPVPAAALLALLLLPAWVLVAQEGDGGGADPDTGEIFFDRLDVSVVNVEVFVTDKKGNVVTGLGRDDFEIYEDGQPQEVSHFFAVERGRVRGLPALPPAAGAAAEEPALPEPELQELPEDQALRLVVFFDNLFMRPTNRNKVIRLVDDFLLRSIGPQDKVMVVTFERSIHIRQAFTNDLRLVDEALADAELAAGFAMRAGTERRDLIQRVDRARDAYEAEGFVDFYAKSIFHDVSQSIEALDEVVSSMAGLPGRKALLYVSDGIPMTAAEDMFHLLDSKFRNQQFSGTMLASQFRSRRRFRELTSRANANGVTFYTLEAAGMRSHTTLSAEYGQLGDDVTFVEIDSIHDMSLEEPLMMMADATGGLAALNTNNIDGALATVTNDFKNYYSLGYVPWHADMGRYHDIEVKVKRRGLKVRHRTGYRDKVPATRVYEGTLATLLYGAEKNPLEVQVNLGAGRTNDKGQRLLPVEVRIPIGKVALVPREAIHQGQLRVAVALIDDKGRMSPVDQNEFPLQIPVSDLETARQSYYTYAVELVMRKSGEHRIAVGVHDELSGEMSFIRQRVRLEM